MSFTKNDSIGRGQRAQPGHRVGHPVVLRSPLVGIVLLHVGGQDEDVLVHQHPPERGRVNRAKDGLKLRHVRRLLRARRWSTRVPCFH
jgi:hypothetical protein